MPISIETCCTRRGETGCLFDEIGNLVEPAERAGTRMGRLG